MPRVGRRGSRGRVPGTERPENFIFAKGLNTDGSSPHPRQADGLHEGHPLILHVFRLYFTRETLDATNKPLRSHRETRDRHEDRIFLLKKI